MAVAPGGGTLVATFGDGTIRHLAADGTVSPYAEVDAPAGMDVAADGTLYVTSIRSRTVHRVDPATRAGHRGPAAVKAPAPRERSRVGSRLTD
jgi:streptogramin lyase